MTSATTSAASSRARNGCGCHQPKNCEALAPSSAEMTTTSSAIPASSGPNRRRLGTAHSALRSVWNTMR